jgi:hypothetical protein
VDAVDGDRAQALDGRTRELGELVEEQHAVVGKRDLAGTRRAAATEATAQRLEWIRTAAEITRVHVTGHLMCGVTGMRARPFAFNYKVRRRAALPSGAALSAKSWATLAHRLSH